MITEKVMITENQPLIWRPDPTITRLPDRRWVTAESKPRISRSIRHDAGAHRKRPARFGEASPPGSIRRSQPARLQPQ